MSIYQHFREEEHPFIDQVLSWKEMVEKTYQAKLSDFLDPREQQIVQSLIGNNNQDINLQSTGGGAYSERKRIVLAPYYEEITDESFQLVLMQASFNEKFITLSHRDVMGAFLSQGISRTKLGDIHVTDGKLQIIMAEEIADYVAINLTTIKNATIKLERKPFSALIEKEMNWLEMTKTVSSLRLDVVLKEMYQLSRKASLSLIEKKRVKVNFKTVEKGNFELLAGDLISVRGKGRGKLMTIDGRTKKDKLRITTALLK